MKTPAAASVDSSVATGATEHGFAEKGGDVAIFVRGYAHNVPESGYDVMGNLLIQLPTWPVARPHLASRRARREREELRFAYAWATQKEQSESGTPILPPCSWCGAPTGNWCEGCSKDIANPVCSHCEDTDEYDLCRECQGS